MSRRHKLGMGMVLALALAAPASAQQYFGEDLNGNPDARLTSRPNSTAARNSFFSRLSGVGTESFESFSDNQTPPLVLSFPGAGTATLTGGGYVNTIASGTNGVGRYPTAGNNYYELGLPSSFRIDFSAPVAAFGFYGVDIGEFGSRLFVDFMRTGGATTTIEVPHTLGTGTGSPPDGGLLYLGFIDSANPFNAVQFRASGGESFGFDEMTIGSLEQVQPPVSGVAPEPVSMALLGTGLAGVAGAARRRRRKPEA